MCAHECQMCVATYRRQKKVWDFLKMTPQVVGSHLTWVLGTELLQEQEAPSPWVISPAGRTLDLMVAFHYQSRVCLLFCFCFEIRAFYIQIKPSVFLIQFLRCLSITNVQQHTAIYFFKTQLSQLGYGGTRF